MGARLSVQSMAAELIDVAEDPIEIMRAHLEAEPRDLREHAAVSAELAHAVSRAIAKAPSRRWPSARAFAAVVERAAAREVAR